MFENKIELIILAFFFKAPSLPSWKDQPVFPQDAGNQS